MTAGEAVTGAGYVVAAWVLLHAARRRRLATEGMGIVAAAALFGGVVGARLSHWLLVAPGLWWSHPGALFDPRLGGRTILGGVLAGWLAVELTKRRLGIRRSTGDGFALALPAGEAVGRIGCYLNGCCYGAATNLPWAVWQHEAWRHPSQLYTAAWCVAMYLLLRAWRDRLPREGDLFRLYLVLFGLGRFVLEFTRERESRMLGLSAAQWVGLEIAVLGGLLLAASWRRAGEGADDTDPGA
ncbi:MAG: prolipoprotein diacylglyceryl transferase [Armatimonadetes bacterium]|nr:prolipoprotein diacylglyceryl transferase [Armatimonadota bacterium]